MSKEGETKEQTLTRIAGKLVGRKVTIKDSSGYPQAKDEIVAKAFASESGIRFQVYDKRGVEGTVLYIVGHGQHISSS